MLYMCDGTFESLLCRGWGSEAGIQRRFWMGWDGGYITLSPFFLVFGEVMWGEHMRCLGILDGRWGIEVWGRVWEEKSKWDGKVDIIDENESRLALSIFWSL